MEINALYSCGTQANSHLDVETFPEEMDHLFYINKIVALDSFKPSLAFYQVSA